MRSSKLRNHVSSRGSFAKRRCTEEPEIVPYKGKDGLRARKTCTKALVGYFVEAP